MRQVGIGLPLVVTLLLGTLPAGGQEEADGAVRIAVLFDGPHSGNLDTAELFEVEIREILPADVDVRFPAELTREGDHTLAGVARELDELLADPAVHLILALGPLASYDMARREWLARPSIAAFALDPEVLGLPLVDGTSGVPNLSYVAQATELRRDFQAFRDIVSFSTLTVLANPRWADIPGIGARANEAARALGIELQSVPVDRPIEAALASIPEDAEAVYLTPLLHLSDEEWDALVAELNRRRLPTFSMMGIEELERGVLATMRPETFFPQVARRVALNVERILSGVDAGSLPVFFDCGERLTINMATARAIGRFPRWSVLTEADLLHEEEDEPARRLTLARVAHEAVEVNLDLRAQDRAVSAGAEEVGLARSTLLPSVELTATGVFIDEDRAESSFGTQAERTLTGGLGLTQVLFSEPAWANLSIQGALQRGRVHRREEVRLDVALDAVTTYLDVLEVRALHAIERDNVLMTRSNLELARLRRAAGIARAGEVLRWESQIALDRQRVTQVEARRLILELALNRVLHRPLEERFGVEEVVAEVTAEGVVRTKDPALLSSDVRLISFANNQRTWDVFRDFMVAEGLAGSPELHQVDAGIAAQERAHGSATRSFWAPTLALRVGVDNRLSRAGAGSGEFALPGLPAELPPFPQQDDLSWSLGLSVSLPVLTGGARLATRARASAALEQLRIERDAIAERIEQRIRTSLHLLGAAYMSVTLAQQAAKASREHLELVRYAYRGGAVSITEVLDAQQAALGAEQAVVVTIHDFVRAYLAMRRASGRIDLFMTDGEREAFFERLRAYFAASGVEPVGGRP